MTTPPTNSSTSADPTAALHELVHAAKEAAHLARKCFVAASQGRSDAESRATAGAALLEASASAMHAYAAIVGATYAPELKALAQSAQPQQGNQAR